jgi:2-keto-4-pentenoate hydratase/2-oxohepta-3-ene-1,7-dioic acid hydratase in catechol pathway
MGVKSLRAYQDGVRMLNCQCILNSSFPCSSFKSAYIHFSIGRNYADHAKELGNTVPTSPFFFLKPTSSYVDNGGVVEIPKGVDCHFEGEHFFRIEG